MEIGGDDRRNELCRRFRESLADKSAVLFYDEDELIEIFDYAGDLNDDYLRTEALLLGARLYPDSQALKERRAVLYSAFGSDMAAKYLDDNASVEGALWDIMRLRKQLPVGDEAGKALDSLVARYDLFDDEEIIQLTDLASKLGRYDWLVSRLGMLRKKTTYQPTLIFEVAVIAELNNDFKEAIKLLDELTQIEPYNYQYWQMLAELQKKDGDNDGAMSSLEDGPCDKSRRRIGRVLSLPSVMRDTRPYARRRCPARKTLQGSSRRPRHRPLLSHGSDRDGRRPLQRAFFCHSV